jgi:hypothetical protein
LIGHGQAIAVRPDTERRYADDVQRRLRDTLGPAVLGAS